MPDAEEPKAEKMICKRETVTGSLSQRKRTCMTQREWDRLRLNTKDSVQDYIDRAVSVPAVTPG
ncbi:MAG TPA: hypothetical protein VFR36_04175, partial [Sphingomicrobium sp.]|nr:hypothetical protein [Sphingomicrobium sp.]